MFINEVFFRHFDKSNCPLKLDNQNGYCLIKFLSYLFSHQQGITPKNDNWKHTAKSFLQNKGEI